MLFILAMASIGVYGIVLAGWSQQSPYPLLGGAAVGRAGHLATKSRWGSRSSAVFLYAGSLSTSEIVGAQHASLVRHLPLFPSFLMYIVSMVGETNRAPFDLPEAESELVARLPHGVLLDQVRDVLPRGVRQHDDGLGVGDDAVPRRLARARGRCR